MLKIRLAQIGLSIRIGQNLGKMAGLAEESYRDGIDILCFPECALTGYIRDFSRLDYGDVLSAVDTLGQLAKGRVCLIVGTPYVEGDRLFNSAVVLLKDGSRLMYRKQHLTQYDENYFSAGNRGLIFEARGVRCGVAICRDQSHNAVFAEYREAVASVVFLPSAHYYPPKEAGEKRDKNRALPIVRALDNGMCVAKANAVGTVRHRVSLGGSLIVDRRGMVVREAGSAEETTLTYAIKV
ncbi:MAG: carbon-nitrogen hydrolase family protein [Dehalococcoidia bacterium]|nr:carbon-nitrogen hydrolase family protein [Dehalococcoidia bacterium]